MTKAIISAAIFLACLAPLGCDFADDLCLRRPDAPACDTTTLAPLEP